MTSEATHTHTQVESSPPSLRGSTMVQSDEEQPSGHSRRAQRCSSGFWPSTDKKIKAQDLESVSQSKL